MIKPQRLRLRITCFVAACLVLGVLLPSAEVHAQSNSNPDPVLQNLENQANQLFGNVTNWLNSKLNLSLSTFDWLIIIIVVIVVLLLVL